MRDAMMRAVVCAVVVAVCVGGLGQARADESDAARQNRALAEAFQACQTLAERSEPKARLEAARCYVGVAYSAPRADQAPIALFNAMVFYEQAGAFGVARVLGEVLIQRYPKAEQATGALHRCMVLAQASGDWDAALIFASRLSSKDRTGYDGARDALAAGVMMRYAQGDWALLERDVDAWERLFGRMHPQQAAQMAHARVEASRLRDAKTALETHEVWLKRYGRKAPKGLVLRVEADRLELLEASKQDKRVEREAPRLLKRAQALKDNRAAAVAQLALARQLHRSLDTRGLTRVKGPEAIKAFLDRYLVALREAEDAYMRVVELRAPELVPSAVLGVASIYMEFAEALLDAPSPKIFDQDQHDAYRMVIEDKADSIAERGCKTAKYGARALLEGGAWSPDTRALVELAQRCEGALVWASEVDVSAVVLETPRPSFAKPKARVKASATVKTLRRAAPDDHARWYALAHRAWDKGDLKTAAEAGAAAIGPHPEAARLASALPADDAKRLIDRVAKLPNPAHLEHVRLATAAAYALGRCDDVTRLSAPLAQAHPDLMAYALGCLAQRPTSQGWELVAQLVEALERSARDPDAAAVVVRVLVETTQALVARKRDARALPHALHMCLRARQHVRRVPAKGRDRVDLPLRHLEAWLRLKAHQPEGALGLLPSALGKGSPTEQTLRVAALVSMGELDQARAAADALIKAAPDDPTARYHAALAQLTPALKAPFSIARVAKREDAQQRQLDAVCAKVRDAVKPRATPPEVKASAERWLKRACSP